jgi:hypothetical protein
MNKEKKMIELSLEFSDKGTPYIEMFNLGRLIFSPTIIHPLGYKWFCYVRNYETTINIGTKEKPNYSTITDQDAIMYNMKLYRDTECTWGVKKATIPKPVQKWLRNTLKQLGVFSESGDLIVPKNEMLNLKELIDQTDFEKMVNPPKKKKVRKTNKKLETKALKILSEAS